MASSVLNKAMSEDELLQAITECVEWTGAKNGDGYGSVRYRGRVMRAHRVAWERAYGPIPAGLQVLHRCDNPPCVNLNHLWLGTNTDNIHDAIAKGRRAAQKVTHCPRGHEYTPENTKLAGTRRQCRICANRSTRRYKLRRATA